MDDRTARIMLACLVEPGTAGIAQAVAEEGAPHVLARAWRQQQADLAVLGRLAPDDVPPMLDDMARLGVRVVVPGEPEFPTQLLDLAEPPLALWLRGPLDLRGAGLRSLAVVGSRACTAYGERATSTITSDLAASGWAIVSGAAFGIDAAAHRAALSVGGPTVAVLACGVDVVYPRAHDSLLGRIADEGLVLSELPPGSLPLRFRFLARNRLIAALTRGTLVVEAARRSGAISTANRALELGRVLMATPGPITSMASSGSNRLLHEGAARAVATAEEVVALLLEGGAGASPGASSVLDREVPTTSEEPPAGSLARQVLDALSPRRPRSVAEVADRLDTAELAVLAELGMLELRGTVRRDHRGWRRAG